jgi:hypothetical protein
MSAHQKLLAEIAEFLSRAGMAETTFGRLSVNDGKFVARIRAGGRCWPETEKKARAFMRAHSVRSASAA